MNISIYTAVIDFGNGIETSLHKSQSLAEDWIISRADASVVQQFSTNDAFFDAVNDGGLEVHVYCHVDESQFPVEVSVIQDEEFNELYVSLDEETATEAYLDLVSSKTRNDYKTEEEVQKAVDSGEIDWVDGGIRYANFFVV